MSRFGSTEIKDNDPLTTIANLRVEIDVLREEVRRLRFIENRARNVATIEGCVTWTHLDPERRSPLLAELANLRAIRTFLDEEVLPRYMEMFGAAGLGEWTESVIYQRACELLGK